MSSGSHAGGGGRHSSLVTSVAVACVLANIAVNLIGYAVHWKMVYCRMSFALQPGQQQLDTVMFGN
jgi:hypothetical protein